MEGSQGMTVAILNFMANPFETSSLKAWADIQLKENGCAILTLCGLKLIQCRDGHLAVKMPSLRQGNSYKTLCHIDEASLHKKITKALIERYEVCK